MSNDTITIIMAVYNVAATITETIQSVLNQTYKNIVLLVIDDCSTDGTSFIVSNFTKIDSRVHYIKMPQHQGISYVRNYGIDHAVGDWVAFLDGDDLWQPTKIEKQVALRDRMLKTSPRPLLDNGDPNPLYPGILFTATAYCNKKGEMYDYVLKVPEMIKFRKLLKQNILSCSSIFANRKVVDKFPVDGNLHEDFYTWLCAMKKGYRAYGINEPLLTYRLTPDGQSSNKMNAAKLNYNVYKKLRFNPVFAFYYMVFYAIKNANKYSKIKKAEAKKPNGLPIDEAAPEAAATEETKNK